MSIPYPSDFEIDRAQAMRDRHDEWVKAQLNWAVILEDLKAAFGEALQSAGALGELFDTMKDAPVMDAYDRDGYLKYTAARDGARVGQAVMALVSQVVLAAVHAVDEQPC